MPTTQLPADELLAPHVAGKLAGVSPRTLLAWEAAGKIVAQRTAGGHRRYWRNDLLALTAAPAPDCERRQPRVDELGKQ